MRRGRKPNYRRERPKNDQPLVAMLSVRHQRFFKYDVRDVLGRSDIDPVHASSLLASLIAIGSRNSIKAAKEHVVLKFEEGIIDEKTKATLILILNDYSKRR